MARLLSVSKSTVLFGAVGALLLWQAAKGQDPAEMPYRGRSCAPSCNAAQCGPAIDENAISTEAVPEINTGSVASSFGAASGPSSPSPHMIGDFLGSSTRAGSGSFSGEISEFTTRTFKVAENQSARPVDRFFVNYSYYNDVGGSETAVNRVVFGGEQRILDGQASLGLRLPVNMVNPDVTVGFGGGTNNGAAFGDITLVGKYALFQDDSYGDVFSGGIALTAPTGPNTFAGVSDGGVPSPVKHNGTIQPFLAGLRFIGQGFFLQGFSQLDIPFDSADTVLMFNDVAFGNYIYTNNGGMVTAVVPTMEIHHNTPLANRRVGGAFLATDQINLTTALTLMFGNGSSLALGLVNPVGDDDIYDYEFQAQFNVFSGGFYGLRRY